jgi:hypothetical protein
MPTVGDMATTTLGDQPFSRIVETRKTTSWSVGVPIAIFVVAAVALIAYFAAKGTQAHEQLAQAQQSAQQNQQALTQLQQKMSTMDAEFARLRDAGRTTVILQSVSAGKRGKVAAGDGAWGAATWGEQPDGKSWVRLNAYGLAPAPSAKAYGVWFVSAAGDSIQVGKLDPNTDGSAFLEGRDLPGVDQGKSLLVSLDGDNAKTPGQVLFQASLPKLTPSQHAAVPSSAKEQAQEQSGAQSDTAQGRRAAPQKR